MKHFSLNLETMSPVAIRADHAPGGVENAGYISGTTLQGSLAALHRLLHPEPGDVSAFEQLFLSGQVQFPDLYPASFKKDPLRDSINEPIYPLPKTAQSCKRYPGFKPRKGLEEDEDDGHGARDSLIDMALFALAERAERNGQTIDWNKLLTLLQKWAVCHFCNKPMDHFSGYYRRSDVEQRMAKASAEMRLQTRTGINRETGTVQESILYSREVFQEHMRFWGKVVIDDSLAPLLQQFIEEVGRAGLVRIGTGRSRGMGKVNLALEELRDSEQQRSTSFKERLTKFDAILRKQVQEASLSLELAPFYFAVTLHSPVILRDALLRYRGVIDEQALGELLQTSEEAWKIPADSFALLYQNAATREILGWNELWGLPRTKEIAIDTGSVFLFATTIKDEEGLEKLLNALFKIEQAGIGRRKAEGFGRICVSDQFHQEIDLR